MIQYTWRIAEINVFPQKETLNDVVCKVYWNVLAEEGPLGASDMGVCDFPYDPTIADTFTPFEELTQEQVLDWVESYLKSQMIQKVVVADGSGEESMEENNLPVTVEISRYDYILEALAERIEVQKNPPIIYKPLPWADK